MKYSAKSIEDYYVSMAKGKIPQNNMYVMQKGRGSSYNRKTKPLYYINQSGDGPKVISPATQDLEQAKSQLHPKGIKRKRSASKSHSRKRSRTVKTKKIKKKKTTKKKSKKKTKNTKKTKKRKSKKKKGVVKRKKKATKKDIFK